MLDARRGSLQTLEEDDSSFPSEQFGADGARFTAERVTGSGFSASASPVLGGGEPFDCLGPPVH